MSEKVNLKTSAGGTFSLDWETWRPVERTVLCLLRRPGEVLLIEKKSGFGKGKISMPGGHIEHAESPLEAAVRETREEVGLTPTLPVRMGQLRFAFTDADDLFCALYVAEDYTGNLAETEEAAPFWCAESEIPYDRMWADDAVWVPNVLAGRQFIAGFVFEGDVMLWRNIEFPATV